MSFIENSMAQNSYLNRFVKSHIDTGKKSNQRDDSISQTSHSIEQLSHNYSTQSAQTQPRGQQLGTNCNLLEIVKKMKGFKIDSATSVRNYLIKKGIRLFYDLNDNLNGYRQPFCDEKLVEAKVPYLKHLNGEKFELSPPEAYNFRNWEQWDIIEIKPMA